MQRAEKEGRERDGRHRLLSDPEFRAHKRRPTEIKKAGVSRAVETDWTAFSRISRSRVLGSRRTVDPQGTAARGAGAQHHHAPAAPAHRGSPASRVRRLPSAGPCIPRAGRRTDSRSLPTPRPQTSVPVPGGRLPGLPRGGQPPSTPTLGRRTRTGPLPKRQSRRARSPSRAGRRVLPLTDSTSPCSCNFASRETARDFVALRARPQAEARLPSRAERPAGLHWGCAGRRGGVPTALTSSQAPGASSLFPPTWSPAFPHTRELMHTLGQSAAANGEEIAGADLNWKRKHRLREPPQSFGLAFVVAPAEATRNEFSSA